MIYDCMRWNRFRHSPSTSSSAVFYTPVKLTSLVCLYTIHSLILLGLTIMPWFIGNTVKTSPYKESMPHKVDKSLSIDLGFAGVTFQCHSYETQESSPLGTIHLHSLKPESVPDSQVACKMSVELWRASFTCYRVLWVCHASGKFNYHRKKSSGRCAECSEVVTLPQSTSDQQEVTQIRMVPVKISMLVQAG